MTSNSFKKIGLLGKMASGKSTLAKECIRQNPQYKRIAFADKIKDLAIELFGMTQKDRKLLQQIGEKMRSIDPDVWIHYVLKQTQNQDYIIIDDVRYLNEIVALKNAGFSIIYLESNPQLQLQRLQDTYGDDYTTHLNRFHHESECADQFQHLADLVYQAKNKKEMQEFVSHLFSRK